MKYRYVQLYEPDWAQLCSACNQHHLDAPSVLSYLLREHSYVIGNTVSGDIKRRVLEQKITVNNLRTVRATRAAAERVSELARQYRTVPWAVATTIVCEFADVLENNIGAFPGILELTGANSYADTPSLESLGRTYLAHQKSVGIFGRVYDKLRGIAAGQDISTRALAFRLMSSYTEEDLQTLLSPDYAGRIIHEMQDRRRVPIAVPLKIIPSLIKIAEAAGLSVSGAVSYLLARELAAKELRVIDQTPRVVASLSSEQVWQEALGGLVQTPTPETPEANL